ncbi:MAG: hypothetical protein LAP21_09110 [Acidobacteriia bacterium]|nr:hypothetical protein [Terriglobia bacterium]
MKDAHRTKRSEREVDGPRGAVPGDAASRCSHDKLTELRYQAKNLTNNAQMTYFFIQPQTLRPPFPLVITFLWGDSQNVDTEGDSRTPAIREWTELYCQNREVPQEIFEVSPVANEPLKLRIESAMPELAARVAYFLAKETGSMVATNEAGPWHDPEWLFSQVGIFDLAKATQRAAQSPWRHRHN